MTRLGTTRTKSRLITRSPRRPNRGRTALPSGANMGRSTPSRSQTLVLIIFAPLVSFRAASLYRAPVAAHLTHLQLVEPGLAVAVMDVLNLFQRLVGLDG